MRGFFSERILCPTRCRQSRQIFHGSRSRSRELFGYAGALWFLGCLGRCGHFISENVGILPNQLRRVLYAMPPNLVEELNAVSEHAISDSVTLHIFSLLLLMGLEHSLYQNTCSAPMLGEIVLQDWSLKVFPGA